VCGALVMVLEILGSRVIGPFFGVSLFVWTALITVTLVALAAGAAIGGVLADRRADPDWLFALLLAAGALVILVPLDKGPILRAAMGLGVRTGALASAAALFGPPLVLLGCVTPAVIRLAARDLTVLGRTIGLFSALSTLGSFVGTVLTGFVLLARFGVNGIFAVVGTILLALGAVYFAVFRRRWQALAALAVPALLFATPVPGPATLSNGVRVEPVARRESPYGTVRVVDYRFSTNHAREMTIDGLVQGGIDVDSGQSTYGYTYLLGIVPWLRNPGGKTCLSVGLGGGTIPVWYERMGVRADVVDIDPEVVALAREYFGFRVSGDVVIGDGRHFLQSATRQWDFIILDAFTGDTTPAHLLSLESLQAVRARLAPGGVFGINLIGAVRGDTFITASIVETLRRVFRTVEIVPLFGEPDESGNMIVVAHDGPAPPLTLADAARFPIHPAARGAVEKYFGREFSFPPGTPAIVLKDDYNPMEFYDLRVKERVRASILGSANPDMLL
jgi:spermidine synthase